MRDQWQRWTWIRVRDTGYLEQLVKNTVQWFISQKNVKRKKYMYVKNISIKLTINFCCKFLIKERRMSEFKKKIFSLLDLEQYLIHVLVVIFCSCHCWYILYLFYYLKNVSPVKKNRNVVIHCNSWISFLLSFQYMM